MENDLNTDWKELLQKLEPQFGEGLELEGIIFLVGVQELGQGFRKFSKSEKMDIMHIAICRLLSGWGYYELEGTDKDGWPHWKVVEKLPPLNVVQQQLLLKEAIVEYFRELTIDN